VKVFISTTPFGETDDRPRQLLRDADLDYVINPLGRKLKEDELASLISDSEILIAGTETISDKVLKKALRLKLICRVGIGLDGVDLWAARRRGVAVAYTPDAPSPAVAELTIGLMITLLRKVHLSDSEVRKGQWNRYFGRRLSQSTVGILGVGRIGSIVANHLAALGCKNILVNDIDKKSLMTLGELHSSVEVCSKERIYKEADVITIHLPLTKSTKDLIRANQLMQMKKDAVVINTSRGGIICESDLYSVMKSGYLGGAGIDVFETEPYMGPLGKLESCILTAHMGSMSFDCRSRMEIEATEDAIRFATGELIRQGVPEEEFEAQLIK